MNKIHWLVWLPLMFSLGLHAEVEITPSDVFSQVVQLDKEIEIFLSVLGIKQEHDIKQVSLDLQPRHVWQTAYAVMVKLNAYRRTIGLPLNSANSLEPVLQLDPILVYEQTQRLLTEVRILKVRLGIEQQISAAETFSGKRPIDVFNQLHEISLHVDALNAGTISPSLIFAEVMRIYEDVDAIERRLNIQDRSYPPEKRAEVSMADALAATFDLMTEIQRLQRSGGLTHTDFSVFQKKEAVQHSDVFNMVGMALAELQTIKARLDMKHTLTPPAGYYQDKTVADLHQLLSWVSRKLQLIHSL